MYRLKQILPFVFILIFVLVSFRYLFFISSIRLQKSEFRRQLIESSDKQIIQLEIDAKELFKDKAGLEWKKNNKELLVNGEYHEVIGLKKINGKIIVSIIEDKAENELFKKYFGLNNKVNSGLADLIKLLLNFNCVSVSFDTKVLREYRTCNPLVTKLLFTETDFKLRLIKPPCM